MTASPDLPSKLAALDPPTGELARLAAVATAGGVDELRVAVARARDAVPPVWVEELLLQTYLFAGFPRALNAMREWRRICPNPAGMVVDARENGRLLSDGEATCAEIYGPMYERLRNNVRRLHPALDAWMILGGYGTVLSRPGLDLARRELCIVAACAAAEQERQLHSHLHGALNAGVAPEVIDALLVALSGTLTETQVRSARHLWTRIRGK